MKKIIFFAAALLWTAAVNAADVKNTDAERYELLVKTEKGAFKTELEPNGYIANLCSRCTIEVVGYSLIDVESEKLVVVDDGIVRVEKQ